MDTLVKRFSEKFPVCEFLGSMHNKFLFRPLRLRGIEETEERNSNDPISNDEIKHLL